MFRRRLLNPGYVFGLLLAAICVAVFTPLLGMLNTDSAQAQAITLPGAAPADADASSGGAVGGPRLRWIERRRLGLTVKNVRKALEELKAEGKLAAYVETTEDGAREIKVSSLAVAVADKLASERPEAWGDNIDWDQVLAWIEQIIELLIKYLPLILDLFTVNAPPAPAVAACPAPLVLAA